MKNNRNIFYIAFLSLCAYSCEQIIGIDPGIFSEETLVIEGGVTNLPPPYSIKLRTVSNVTGTGTNTLGIGASVIISDDKGNSEILIEQSAGNYATVNEEITGLIGNAYKLNIRLRNGEEYNSEFDIMPEPVDVSRLYEEKIVEDIINDDLIVLGTRTFHKIFSEIVNDDDKTTYIKSNQEMTIIEQEIGLNTGCEGFGPTKCYVLRGSIISELYLTSNLNVSSDVFGFEIAEVPVEFRGLYYSKFSLESISAKAYDFYEAIEEQLEREGTIFDPSITKVPSNISPVGGVTRNVEGFFRAYSVTTAEICYDRSKVMVTVDIPSPLCEFCWDFFAPAVRELPEQLKNCL